jgi:hypothetical protein
MREHIADSISPGRPVWRPLVLLVQWSVLVVGSIFSLAVFFALFLVTSAYLGATSNFDVRRDRLLLLTLFSSQVLPGLGFAAVNRKIRPWKVKYDAGAWTGSELECQRHPSRRRYKRIARQILVWVPSVIAAMVLFFLPVVTHLKHPYSRYLEDYRVPISWRLAVFPSPGPLDERSWVDVVVSSGRERFGLTPFAVSPFWIDQPPASLMTFGSSPDANSFDFAGQAARTESSEVVSREFRLGESTLTCLQYRQRIFYLGWPGPGLLWNVDCETPPTAHGPSFHARFEGFEDDLRAFYQIIEGVTPVKKRSGEGIQESSADGRSQYRTGGR